MTEETTGPADECLETRMAMFLETLAAVGGQTDASDHAHNWIMAFCSKHEGRDPDTFNLAIQHEFTHVTHDNDTDDGTVYLTDNGRRAIPRLREQAAALRAQPKDAGVSEVVIDTVMVAELNWMSATINNLKLSVDDAYVLMDRNRHDYRMVSQVVWDAIALTSVFLERMKLNFPAVEKAALAAAPWNDEAVELDPALERPLRSALRFAGSRAAITAEEERAILAAFHLASRTQPKDAGVREAVRRDYARAIDIENAARDAVDRIEQSDISRLPKTTQDTLVDAAIDLRSALEKPQGCGISEALAALTAAPPRGEAEKLLKPFADYADQWHDCEPDSSPVYAFDDEDHHPTLGHCRAARNYLASDGQP